MSSKGLLDMIDSCMNIVFLWNVNMIRDYLVSHFCKNNRETIEQLKGNNRLRSKSGFLKAGSFLNLAAAKKSSKFPMYG